MPKRIGVRRKRDVFVLLLLQFGVAYSLFQSPAFITRGLQLPFNYGRRSQLQTRFEMSSDNQVTEIKTSDAPEPVGPYSQAVSVVKGAKTIYLSGQIALDPATGAFIEGFGEIQAETKQVMKNLNAVLEAAGATPKDVVKCMIFLADLNDFAAMNEIYSDFFKDNKVLPARSCVQAGALPKGAKVEIECVVEL